MATQSSNGYSSDFEPLTEIMALAAEVIEAVEKSWQVTKVCIA